jgi:hypothetical protein
MTTVYNATHKNVYFTELCTCDNNFSGELANHMENVMIGSLINWGKTAIEWNLATDSNLGPHTDNGGCGVCYGGITVNSPTTYSHNASYYIVGQISKVIKTNAVRIATTTTNTGLANVACVNTDGTRALVVYNGGNASASFDVVWNGQACPFTLATNSVASFSWQGSTPVGQIMSPPATARGSIRSFPEPFATAVRISVSLLKKGYARVLVCNSKGVEIATLLDGIAEKGNLDLTWTGTNRSGMRVTPGIYIVKFGSECISVSKRLFKD